MSKKSVETTDLINHLADKFSFNHTFSKQQVAREIAEHVAHKFGTKQSKGQLINNLYNKYGKVNQGSVNKAANAIADDLYHKESVPLTKATLVEAMQYIHKNHINEADYGKVVDHLKQQNSSRGLPKKAITQSVKHHVNGNGNSLSRSDAKQIVDQLTDYISVKGIISIVASVMNEHNVDGSSLTSSKIGDMVRTANRWVDANLYNGITVHIAGVGTLRRAKTAATKPRVVKNYLHTTNASVFHVPAKPAHYRVAFRPSKVISKALLKENLE